MSRQMSLLEMGAKVRTFEPEDPYVALVASDAAADGALIISALGVHTSRLHLQQRGDAGFDVEEYDVLKQMADYEKAPLIIMLFHPYLWCVRCM